MHQPMRLVFDGRAQMIDQIMDRSGAAWFAILGSEGCKRLRDARRRRRAARKARFQRDQAGQDQVLQGRQASFMVIDEFAFGFGHGASSPVSDTAEPSAGTNPIND